MELWQTDAGRTYSKRKSATETVSGEVRRSDDRGQVGGRERGRLTMPQRRKITARWENPERRWEER